MARPKSLKCPSCGAQLTIDLSRPLAKCEYCGASVERDVKPKRRPPAQAAPAVPGGGFRKAWAIGSVVWVILMIVGVGAYVFHQQQAIQESIQSAYQAASSVPASDEPSPVSQEPERWGWEGWRQPFLLDTDDDGALEIVGWIRLWDDQETPTRLASFDAATQERRWLAPGFSDGSQATYVTAYLAGDRLVVTDPSGVLRAIAPKDGKELWRVPLGERVKEVCALEDASLVEVITADERLLHIKLATGEIDPQGKVPRRHHCRPIHSDNPGLTDKVLLHGDNFWGGPRPPRIAGMETSKVLRDLETGRAFALGYRKPGTRVPTVAAFEPKVEPFTTERRRHQRKRDATWLVAVPSGNALEAQEEAPETAGYGEGRLFVPYRMSDWDKGCHLAAFDATNGETLWDVVIPDSGHSRAGAVVTRAGRVYVPCRSKLHVFEAETGAHLFALGN